MVFRWNPRLDIDRVVDDLDRLVSDSTRRRGIVPRLLGLRPALDLYDTGEQLVLKAAIPGAKPEDIDIALNHTTITLRGRFGVALPEEEAERATFYQRELDRREFVETITLPEAVDAEQASASFADGILTLVMPKTADTRAKRIPVRALAAAS